MKQSDFNKVQLNSFVKRLQFPSTDIALECQQYRLARQDYYESLGYDYDDMIDKAEEDTAKRYYHLRVYK
jgi:hypothetical protein